MLTGDNIGRFMVQLSHSNYPYGNYIYNCVHSLASCFSIVLLMYPLQLGHTPLHLAAKGGHTTCVEHLISTPGIDVNIKDMRVSWYSRLNVSLLISMTVERN